MFFFSWTLKTKHLHIGWSGQVDLGWALRPVSFFTKRISEKRFVVSWVKWRESDWQSEWTCAEGYSPWITGAENGVYFYISFLVLQPLKAHLHTHLHTNGSNLGFIVLPKDTSTCRLDEPGIELIFRLMDGPALSLLSCSASTFTGLELVALMDEG